jgi:hypothetical protein
MKAVSIRNLFSSMIIMLCLVSSYGQEADTWKFVREKDGITIYTREEPNTNVKSFRGEADLKTTMEKMKHVVGRTESFQWWDESVKDIKVLEYQEEKLIRYYLVYDVPWPLTDRDLCAEAIINNDSVTGIRTVRATALPGVVPEYDDKVRITYYWQQWTIVPKENGIVHVKLEGSVDPGGAIPTWLVNMVITDTPLNIITKLRNVVEK